MFISNQPLHLAHRKYRRSHLPNYARNDSYKRFNHGCDC